MKEFILHIIGCLLLWVAVDIGRENKSKLFTKDWWIILFLLLIGTELIKLKW